ncbi:hypothetical protein RHMOL_Rhmol10G0201800 [Rhododendron molle]|uniref:Uncharacterized protein n=1 Tax=Rhododendron molle TaxID=49168 RepID=A0ACC0M4A7_RHOML|nr:hypothetical protein RHMOL_Rhmol10G0201800 [Rhododendron molle]
MVAGSGDGTTVLPASWVAPEKMKLEYIPPVVLNDRVVVSPPADVEALGQSKWEKCIVGHFLDKRLGFSGVKTIAMNIWERFGIRDVLSNEKGFFFFLFEGEKFHQLLEGGPWHFGGKLLILKLWHPHLKLEKVQLSTIPLWVHFYNIPLELWTGPGFSYIASSVGRPLYVDKLTESGKTIVPSSQAWQVVGTLRKDAPGVVGIRPHLSLHSMPASTSMPAVSNNNSGVSVAATVIQPIPVPITEGLTTLEGAKVANMFGILDSSTLGVPHGPTIATQISDSVPSSNQFAAHDVPDLSGTEEVYSRHISLGLPDDLFEAPHASSVDIVSEIVADFVVAPSQRDVSPLISVKGKGQGGGKGPPNTRAGGKKNKR